MRSSLVLVSWNPGFLGLNSQFFILCVLLIHKGVRVDKVRPVFVRGVVGNRKIPKLTVGGAARVDTEVQRA